MATRATISRRALIARLNRTLTRQGKALRASRGGQTVEMGEYYLVDVARGIVAARNVEPVKLARELGALAEWEDA